MILREFAVVALELYALYSCITEYGFSELFLVRNIKCGSRGNKYKCASFAMQLFYIITKFVRVSIINDYWNFPYTCKRVQITGILHVYSYIVHVSVINAPCTIFKTVE